MDISTLDTVSLINFLSAVPLEYTIAVKVSVVLIFFCKFSFSHVYSVRKRAHCVSQNLTGVFVDRTLRLIYFWNR